MKELFLIPIIIFVVGMLCIFGLKMYHVKRMSDYSVHDKSYFELNLEIGNIVWGIIILTFISFVTAGIVYDIMNYTSIELRKCQEQSEHLDSLFHLEEKQILRNYLEKELNN